MILRDESFKKGEFDTHYIENSINGLVYEDEQEKIDLVFTIAAAISAHSHS